LAVQQDGTDSGGSQLIPIESICLGFLAGIIVGDAPAGVDGDLTERQVPAETDPTVAIAGAVGQS
jgi:hypothetical protein